MDVIEPGSSGRDETDALVEGPKWAGTTITFSFPTLAGYSDYGGVGEVATNFQPFNAIQQTAVRSILSQVSSFTGLTFVDLGGSNAGSATLRFAATGAEAKPHAYLPSTDAKGGDVWLSTKDAILDSPKPGIYAWISVLHQIGHALGLGHPDLADPPFGTSYDWMSYTVMNSVIGRESLPYASLLIDFAQTFMPEDIAALQFLYGANYSFRADDTVYRWNMDTGEMSVNGVAQGKPVNPVVFSTLWDGGGTDTYDFSDSNRTFSAIDLNPGAWSYFSDDLRANLGSGNSPPGNFANALLVNGDPRSLIENVIGTGALDRINGNQLANIIIAGKGNDEVFGNDGDDLLDGGDGSDRLNGGNGADTVLGGPGTDILAGGDGADRLFGDDDYDKISGEAGDDHIDGGKGNDDIDGGDGADFIDGGEDNDFLLGNAGNDTLIDRQGSNYLVGGDGNDTLVTGSGNDRLEGGRGADVMTGGPGDDFYSVDDIGDVINEVVGEGYDWLSTVFSTNLSDAFEAVEFVGFGNATLIGNASDNWLRSGYQNDILDGGGGADRMEGLAGDDIYYVDNAGDLVVELAAAPGFDTVYASVNYVLASSPPPPEDPYSGASQHPPITYAVEMLVLTGTADLSGTGSEIGNIIVGNVGRNLLSGLAGDDILMGRQGADTLIGGPGIDTASYENDEGGVFVNLSLGRGYGNASFGDTYDSIENVIGTAYNDFLIGDPGVNRLDGAGGDDTIIGAVGADVIIGGSGFDWASYEDNSGVVFINLTLAKGYNNAAEGDTYEGVEHLVGGLMDDFFIGNDGANRLNGAMGADTLLGAGGADIFMFTYAPGATSVWGNPNVDLILDFATGVDRIELSAGAFPGLPVGTLAAGAFWAGTAAHDGDDRILYDAASGKLFFDPDGTGGQAALLFAVLGETSHPAALAASDFVVV